MQLRDVAADLRKTDEPLVVVAALKYEGTCVLRASLFLLDSNYLLWLERGVH